MRSGLNSELDFDTADRAENLRRAAETAHIINQHGIIVLCAFVSPNREIRAQIADIVGHENFMEIFIDTPLDICRKNDKTGLYKKADQGIIKNVAGVSFPYEKPEKPALKLDMKLLTPENAANEIFEFLVKKN